MEINLIAEIVQKAFEKAKKECSSHSKYALSKHIGIKITLSSKTLERAYDRHIEEIGEINDLSESSVKLLCNYLGYDTYEDYAASRGVFESEKQSGAGEERNTKRIRRKKHIIQWSIKISIVLGIILTLYVVLPAAIEHRCMAWASTQYKQVSCNTSPYSEFGTEVVPFEESKYLNLKKVEVTMATDFFAEGTNRPLIWYSKSKQGEIEFFTSPGLHPITGKTLDEITPYIIQKYVPMHTNDKGSFLK